VPGGLYITPDGKVHKYTSGGYGAIQGDVVATLTPEYYQDLNLIYDAIEEKVYTSTVDVRTKAFNLRKDLGLQYRDPAIDSFNWGKLRERWIPGAEGGFFITPDGRVYKYISGVPGSVSRELVAILTPEYYQDLSLLTTAEDPAKVDAKIDAYAIKNQLGLEYKGGNTVNWGGLNEKWLPGADGKSYFITPDGKLYRWISGTGPANMRGEFVATLSPEHYDNLYLIYDAQPPGTVEPEIDAASIKNQFGLTYTGNDSYDWGGKREKWLLGDGGTTWYYITPDGKLYRYTGGGRGTLQGELVATLSSKYHEDLSLLYDA